MEKCTRRKVIVTCFAGRESCMSILLAYVRRLLDEGHIDEFHAWDYTRQAEDGAWLARTISQCDGNMKLHAVRDKTTWVEYYKHYTKKAFRDCVIIKLDDDIVFIDVDTFQDFIREREQHPEYLLLFPAIWNNEMINFYMQQRGMMPKECVGKMNGEKNGSGALWKSGRQAEAVHRYLCQHLEEVKRNGDRGHVSVPPTDRVSINYFAILGEDLDVFQQCWMDDELWLTQRLPKQCKRSNGIYFGHAVSHLSFCGQVESGFDAETVLGWYRDILRKQ